MDWQLERMPLNPYGASPERVTPNHTLVLNNPAATRESKTVPEVLLGWFRVRKAIHAGLDFHQAFPAFALLAAGGRHLNAELLGTFKKALPRHGLDPLMIKKQLEAHPAGFCSRFLTWMRGA
jgi:hypothetical protein